MPSEFTTVEDIEAHLLQVLTKKSVEHGVNYSELMKACGSKWKESLARLKGLGPKGLRQMHVNELVHRLWTKGLIVIEPPVGRQRVHRMWSPEAAAKKALRLFTA